MDKRDKDCHYLILWEITDVFDSELNLFEEALGTEPGLRIQRNPFKRLRDATHLKSRFFGDGYDITVKRRISPGYYGARFKTKEEINWKEVEIMMRTDRDLAKTLDAPEQTLAKKINSLALQLQENHLVNCVCFGDYLSFKRNKYLWGIGPEEIIETNNAPSFPKNFS